MNNGIIIDGTIYEAVPKGSCHCSDCDLYDYCGRHQLPVYSICSGMGDLADTKLLFRRSQHLTDRINPYE